MRADLVLFAMVDAMLEVDAYSCGVQCPACMRASDRLGQWRALWWG